MYKKFISLSCSLLSMGAFAQDNIPLFDTPSLLELEASGLSLDMDMVVTPSQLPQPRSDVSSSLSVLDGEFIQRSNMRYVEDLMQFVPGFTVAPYHSSSTKIVSYHGTQVDQYRRIQVLINGRSVYSAGLARVQWAALPISIEDVARVEVNRGPNAASYGINSFFAVINIITKSPLESLGGQLTAYSAANGDSRVYGQYSGLNGKWSYRASASRGKIDGYDVNQDFEERHDGYRNRMGNLYVLRETSDSLFNLDLGASHLESDKDPQDYGSGNYDTNKPVEIVDREHIKLSYSKKVSADHELKVQYYYDRSDSDERHAVNLTPLFYRGVFGEVSAVDIHSAYTVDILEERSDFSMQSIWSATDQLRVITSTGYRVDKAQSETYLSGEAQDSVSHLSSNVEYRLSPKWVINTGAMVEDSKMTDTFFSPKFGVTFKASEHDSLRFNVSKAVRTPDIVDQNFKWHYVLEDGSTSVTTHAVNGEQEERITSYEVGYYKRWPRAGASMDLRLYHDDVEGLMVSRKQFVVPTDLSLADHAVTEGETEDIRIRGAELELDWRSRSGALTRFSYAYQRTDSDNRSIQEYTTPIIVSLLSSVPINDNWSVQGYYLYAKELSGRDYELVNSWLSYKLPLSGLYKAQLGGGIEKRLDNNPLLSARNTLTDDSYGYVFANITF
ncbi:TonB-dependent receptor plug domain-containing protein [Marinomonas epiphytica]